MAIAMMKLYRALRAANVPDPEASDAAEEVAQFENRLARVQTDLAVLKGMVAVNLAMTASLIVKAFT